jgi:uncharacterized membrane protein YphA (DoxX/SURF4 family)
MAAPVVAVPDLAPPNRLHLRSHLAVAWTLQVLGLVLFAVAGAAKITGTPATVAVFEAIGIGQWFRYAAGGLEIIGAVLLMVPTRAGIGAALLSVVMVGAVLTHLVVLHTSPAFPAGLLLAMLAVAWLRREPLIWLGREYGLLTSRARRAREHMTPEVTS